MYYVIVTRVHITQCNVVSLGLSLMIDFTSWAVGKRCSESYNNYQNFGASKITELQLMGVRIYLQVLRLYIPVANSNTMDVSQRSKDLSKIKLDINHRHPLVCFAVVS
nr:hypothetical protein Iba_chr11cCG1270 [Ipomoea batatas]